jgi:hypothetical protein
MSKASTIKHGDIHPDDDVVFRLGTHLEEGIIVGSDGDDGFFRVLVPTMREPVPRPLIFQPKAFPWSNDRAKAETRMAVLKVPLKDIVAHTPCCLTLFADAP